MKVRVVYTVEATDEYRRAINLYHGKPGLATREEVRRFLMVNGMTLDDDIACELAAAIEDEREKQAEGKEGAA